MIFKNGPYLITKLGNRRSKYEISLGKEIATKFLHLLHEIYGEVDRDRPA
jgi:hypothetical protein